MERKLRDLYATLMQIETKGNSTLIMADCLKFLNQCIPECKEAENKTLEQKEMIESMRERIKELEQELEELECEEDDGK